MDKRSLLARIVKALPGRAIPDLRRANQAGRQLARFLGKPGTAQKRISAELVQKDIPANSKEIAIARSYGDLRENHEYKAAKEMQKILMRRKDEVGNSAQPARAGRISPTPKPTSSASAPWCRSRTSQSGQSEKFTILGAWDSDPDKGIISYLTPDRAGVAQPQSRRRGGI